MNFIYNADSKKVVNRDFNSKLYDQVIAYISQENMRKVFPKRETKHLLNFLKINDLTNKILHDLQNVGVQFTLGIGSKIPNISSHYAMADYSKFKEIID